jgi:protein subunit release factor B
MYACMFMSEEDGMDYLVLRINEESLKEHSEHESKMRMPKKETKWAQQVTKDATQKDEHGKKLRRRSCGFVCLLS